MFVIPNLAVLAASLDIATPNAEKRKIYKYRYPSGCYQFMLVSMETLGILVPFTVDSLRKATTIFLRNESFKVGWLLQWVSLTIFHSSTFVIMSIKCG